MSAPRLGIGIIGAGRVGAALGAALRAEGHAITGAYAVSEASRARAAEMLPDVPLLGVDRIVERSELVLLAVPDDQLAPLAAGIAATGLAPGGQIFAHTSGLHGIDSLAPLERTGGIALAMHPAMTFTGTPADLPRLVGCPVAVTARESFLPIAQALVVEIGGEPVTLAEGDRALYHAALSHGANHLVVLVDQARELLASIGIEDPGVYLRPLLTAALEESLRRGRKALTGPVSRGDAGTVTAHLEALAEADGATGDTRSTYRALALAALARAGLGEQEDRTIREILQGPADGAAQGPADEAADEA
ncbi:oxidoreductase [Brachybacterium endophyticum]|uniref:Oxidoreductase n=1 Tax=Brachybacterium endophyticum TaxID=2182385 RepID=A0A2U2RM41_9MICO|nr:DUF2520 domain-containing protein [Brachybacterium endophyticum]PWH06939.1 oxidoreductase [Brachybacterium endophyticum]